MSQPPVTAYFNTRKRRATDDLHIKSKVLLLERECSDQALKSENLEQIISDDLSGGKSPMSPKIIIKNSPVMKQDVRVDKAIRNIQFDLGKTIMEKNKPRTRATHSHKLSCTDGHQMDIRESLQMLNSHDSESRKVLFQKKGTLSPKKSMISKESSFHDFMDTPNVKVENEQPAAGSLIPTKKTLTMEKLATENLSLEDIKNKVTKSSRRMELKNYIARIKNCDEQLKQLQEQDDVRKPQMLKFEKIELEIPVSPQKGYKSPTKALLTQTKDRNPSKIANPQRRILFEPKETTPSPVKCSPSKTPAYQKYLSIAESETTRLALPYNYRFLAEVFRCVDTISAMLFNRKEIITFTKLKPAVQKLVRRNFTLEHLAQIKTIYPDAYTYQQEKYRNFSSVSKYERYELVLTPTVKANNGRNSPDADNVLKTTSENSMESTVLLERRRKFYNALLEKVKDEHEKFLLNLETPINIPKDKIMRWHSEFDIETCEPIEQAELPKPPQIEKPTAKDILDKAKSLFNCDTRMDKALKRLAEANMTSKSSSISSSTQDSTTQITKVNVRKVDITIVDTPPAMPTMQSNYLSTAFKGIPKALLEKVRAKQAAKSLEAMTRTPIADKEATLYSRLPELAKILRNVFVTEKKGVLLLELVIQKLDNSFKTKLTLQEMEKHIRLLCKLLPMWAKVYNVRKMDYLKIDKNVDIVKVTKQLEILANDKVNGS